MKDRPRVIPFWIPLLFGLMALTNVLTRPGFQTIRAVDAVPLVAAGACFGAAFVAFVVVMRDRRTS